MTLPLKIKMSKLSQLRKLSRLRKLRKKRLNLMLSPSTMIQLSLIQISQMLKQLSCPQSRQLRKKRFLPPLKQWLGVRALFHR